MVIEFAGINGSRVRKNNPVSVTISNRQDIPADTADIRCIYDGSFEEYRFVKIFFDEKLIFKGIVDGQKITVGKDGGYVDIACRSMAGVLLDNHLRPQNISGLTDSIIYNSFLRPFDIDIDRITNKSCPELINIGKGVSVYSLIEEYSKRVFRKNARITAQGKAFLSGGMNKSGYLFSDGEISLEKNSYRYSKISLSRSRRNVISRVFVRSSDSETGYPLELKNREIKGFSGVCVRYFDASPSGGHCIQEARDMLEGSNRNSFIIMLECPCFVYSPLYGNAQVVFDGKLYDNMEVFSCVQRFEGKKVNSKIGIRSK